MLSKSHLISITKHTFLTLSQRLEIPKVWGAVSQKLEENQMCIPKKKIMISHLVRSPRLRSFSVHWPVRSPFHQRERNYSSTSQNHPMNHCPWADKWPEVCLSPRNICSFSSGSLCGEARKYLYSTAATFLSQNFLRH